MSRIRVGNNFFQIRIGRTPFYTLREKVDLVVCLDKPSVSIHKRDISSEGIIILDKNRFKISERDSCFFDLPMYEIAEKAGDEIFVNSVACGTLSGRSGIDFRPDFDR